MSGETWGFVTMIALILAGILLDQIELHRVIKRRDRLQSDLRVRMERMQSDLE